MPPQTETQARPDQEIWQLNSARATAWRLWDGEAVVYDDLSGDTLRLDVVMAEVFKCLLDRPSRLPELSRRLAKILDLEDDERLRHVTQTALTRLAARGLAEPRQSPASSPMNQEAAPS